jgi:hypothetical protein
MGLIRREFPRLSYAFLFFSTFVKTIFDFGFRHGKSNNGQITLPGRRKFKITKISPKPEDFVFILSFKALLKALS